MYFLVVVAQLAERWLVEPEVAGSSPVNHPHRPNDKIEVVIRWDLLLSETKTLLLATRF